MRLPDPCLVVLVGPTAAGKSHWAAQWFHPDQVVSSDRLRAVVGSGERDVRASRDAFEVLDLIVAKRLARRLTTVVDTTGLDEGRRGAWRDLAERHGVPAHAVVFETPAEEVRRRNRAHGTPVPANVVTAQLRQAAGAREALAAEGFAGVEPPGPVELVPPPFLTAPHAADRQREDPMTLDFGLQISRFDFEGHPQTTAAALAEIARAAEDAGFSSLWVMDHFLQIPQVGREWEDMLESYTTLAYLAGVTHSIRLGTLVTGITYRSLAHLAKIIATLDVLSGGRAMCGLGAAWFEREHRLYGWDFPPRAQRYARLEDALELLPLMWGPGSPRFEGKTVEVEAATCYPRPLQERIPILVGGAGERRTLRLVARHADACNLFGDPETVRHKLIVLREHCAAEDRDPAAITVTHLAAARVVAEGEPREGSGAASAAEHVGRYRELAEAGVQTAIVGLGDARGPDSVSRFAEVISAFRP
ncbi:MAG TPA: TIGR03560 family F420-dependent LLM class oxidoreductase [Solirubrobacteraceae bacterium]|nr:TIGR03560 family F420-dependent LLM class oxidoreductase [Solirubrobacteraceae bacterium]